MILYGLLECTGKKKKKTNNLFSFVSEVLSSLFFFSLYYYCYSFLFFLIVKGTYIFEVYIMYGYWKINDQYNSIKHYWQMLMTKRSWLGLHAVVRLKNIFFSKIVWYFFHLISILRDSCETFFLSSIVFMCIYSTH